MKKLLIILFSLTLALTLAACGAEETAETSEPQVDQPYEQNAEGESNVDLADELSLEQEVEQILMANLEYSQNKDLESYMATLIEEHQFEETRELLVQIFEAYDLEYTLDSYDIVKVNDDQSQVIVRAIQTTKATWIADGYEFADNRLTFEHTLIRENGSLKFSTSEVIDFEELN